MTTETGTEDLSADFAAGFDAAEPHAEVISAAPPVVETTKEEPGEAATAAAPEPEVVTLTKSEWEETRALVTELSQFRQQATKQFDTLGGKFGEVNRTLQSLPKHRALTSESFAKLKNEYPELGELLAESLAGAPVEAPAAVAIPEEEITRRVTETVAQERERLKEELRAERINEVLSDAHEDWLEVVRSEGFEAWGKTNPDVWNVLLDAQNPKSKDPKFVAKAITDFKESKKPKAPPPAKANAKARLEAAITPQGTPSTGAPAKSELDYFREGYGS